jgi:hypothetical protein
MLFPDVERDVDYADQAMSDYEFLKRCGRPECEKVRQVLENWFQRYPDHDSDELKSRFRSGEDSQFRSSFWELYLHALLLRLGYSVEVHPELETEEETKPDFRASPPDGKSIIVEAVAPRMQTEEPPEATQRKEVVLDTINKLSHPDFRLHMEEMGATRSWPDQSPSGSSVRSQLQGWLDDLDYESLRTELEENGLEAMPSLEFDLKGWQVRFTAVPRSEEKRGTERKNIIGPRSPNPQWIDSSTPLRERIRDKATRYGDIQQPYVVAVNVGDPGLDTIDIMDALYGDEVLVFNGSHEEGSEFELDRKPKGAWVSRQGEINTRVSGVLIGAHAKPWRIGKAPLVLCHNPWAQRPIEGAITSLPEYVDEEVTYQKVEGDSPRNIFDLDRDWPRPSEE